MKKITAKISLLALVGVLILSGVFWGYKASGDFYPTYYSGEAISYGNDVVIGTVNSGFAEIFELRGDNLIKTSRIYPQNGEKDFSDLVFNQKNGRLYLYLVNGRYIYQYDISNSHQPKLIAKTKDNAWDWFYGLSKRGDRILTIGNQGTKVWNQDLQTVNSHPELENKYQYNINFDDTTDYVFNLKENKTEVYEIQGREAVAHSYFNFKGDHFRKAYYDDTHGLFVVDDDSLGKYWVNDLAGKIVKKKEFKHISDHGYDVDGEDDSRYVYFSDGVGVVKSDKYTLEPVDWLFTTGIGEKQGWAQGLNVVRRSNGKEAIVVFNNNNILVLDSNLEVLDHYDSEKVQGQTYHELFLALDKGKVESGDSVKLTGGGFGSNETVIITYLDERVGAKTDEKGSFSKRLTMPSVLPTYTSIKAVGQNSGTKRSISIRVK